MLSDENPYVRRTAAATLCSLGSREGAMPLLVSSEHSSSVRLFVLSALKEPGVWKRCSGVICEGIAESLPLRVLEEICKPANLSLVVSGGRAGTIKKWIRTPVHPSLCLGRSSVVDLVERVLAGSPYDAIIESDKLHLFPIEEATRVWHEWWKYQEKIK
jgi:hypothetical protein